MNYFKKILRFAIPYRKYALLNIFFNILYALFSALSFAALIPMLNVLFDKTQQRTQPPSFTGIGNIKEYITDYMSYHLTQNAGDDPMQSLLWVVGLVIILFLFKNCFNYLAMYFITFLRNGILKDLRNSVYQKLIDLPISYVSEKRKGDLMARITTDILEIQHSFLSILVIVIREPLTILFTIAVMCFISVKLTLFVFIFIPLAGIMISRIGKSLKKKSDDVQKEQGHLLSLIEETLSGLRIIKAFTAESKFTATFQDSTSRFFKYSNTLLHRQNLSGPIGEFLGILVIGVLLWFGGRIVLLDNTLDAASFLAYMGMAYNILTPAKAISKASYTIKKGNAAAERVLSILSAENPIKDTPDTLYKNDFTTSIDLDNISFKYNEDYVLKNLNLHIPKGHTVALVGQSGSGKSTIAQLITRFYDVNVGNILIDGINIKQISKNALRQLIGLVTQDAILFNDTIKNNIRLAKNNATDAEIIAAAKVANAHEFIMELPQGYDTYIGDSGNKLSGGQKQRLSIARAVLKNPPIMILDEATSALDTESERLVQEALEKMMKNRTSLVIAHRLSTIQNADTIIVLHKGQIVEQGTHNDLMKAQKSYRKLVDMQSFS